MNHEHHHCGHDNIKHCKHCDVAYCKSCKKEWSSNFWTTYTGGTNTIRTPQIFNSSISSMINDKTFTASGNTGSMKHSH